MTDNRHPVVCFGEVLWDIFPDSAEPGGAPMNVAYHLHKQGKNPALITRIGQDEKGKELLAIFSDFGVCTDYFQVDASFETGKVFAKPNERDEVVYDIVKPAAWDFIAYDHPLKDLVSNCDYFVFGSLAARNDISQTTLLKLLEVAKYKILDINLRAPHYDRETIEMLMPRADLLKMNIGELELITDWYGAHTSTAGRVKTLREKFGVKDVVITMGGDGAAFFRGEQEFAAAARRVDVVDTVGSGDAFLAGLLSKLHDGASEQEAIDYGCMMGAFIATRRGACPGYNLLEVENSPGR